MNEYTIQRHPHGVAVIGGIPVSDLDMLVKGWKAMGFTLFDALVAKKLGATLVCTSEESGKAWRAELGIVVPKKEAV